MLDKILVTGASSGIGREIAIRLSNLGYSCVLTGRDTKSLNLTLNKMAVGDHNIFDGDLTDENFIDYLSEHITNIKGIVHSAGKLKLSPLRYISRNDFNQIMNVNLFSPFFLTQSLLNKNRLSNGSSIVFVSSISGPIIGSYGNLMYSASKSAINGITKTLALELSSKKIRVNSISAGLILTEMWTSKSSSISNDELLKDAKKYPLGHGNPKDIASLVSFLISEDSSWITGTTIIIDGGYTIQ